MRYPTRPTPGSAGTSLRRALRSRAGISFMYGVLALGALLVLGLIFLQCGLNSAKWSYSHYRDLQAMSLAEAAIDRANWMMQASADGESNINSQLAVTAAQAASGVVRTFNSPAWTMPSGAYSFVAKAPHKGVAGTVEIRGLGIAKNGNREELMVVVRPETTDPDDITGVPAACFRYAMFSDHNFTVSGNPSVLSHNELGGAGIYANGNINFNGASSVIHGPISATGTISGTTTQVPADAGRYQHVDRVPMPEVNVAWYRSHADLVYVGNKVKFNSGHDASIGTYADPKIIFVDGSAEISGQFKGVGTMFATRGIKVTGNCTYADPDSSWAFVTTGAFTVAGTAQIHGLVYAHNATGTAEFIGHGTPNIFGGVVADLITLTGSYTTEWDGQAAKIEALPGTTYPSGPPVIETVLWERI